MAENVSPHAQRKQLREHYHRYGRIRAYGAVGVFVLLGLVIAGLVGYLGLQGPGLFTLEGSLWALAVALLIVSIALLFVLFTLRGTMRIVRNQAAGFAVDWTRSYVDHIERTRPAPTVEVPTPIGVPVEVERAPDMRDANLRMVETIEGIGPKMARRLDKAGILTVGDLRHARLLQVQNAAKVNYATAAAWKAMAELLAIKGIDPQAAEILVLSGIDSPEKLSAADPERLKAVVQRTNRSRKRGRIYPGVVDDATVQAWIDAGKHHTNGRVEMGTSTSGPRPVAAQDVASSSNV